MLAAPPEDEDDPPRKKKTNSRVKYVGSGTTLGVSLLVGIVTFGLGIPLLLICFPIGAGLLAVGMIVPIYGTMVGFLRGPCPYCAHEVAVLASKTGITCRACKNRIVVRNRDFVRVAKPEP